MFCCLFKVGDVNDFENNDKSKEGKFKKVCERSRSKPYIDRDDDFLGASSRLQGKKKTGSLPCRGLQMIQSVSICRCEKQVKGLDVHRRHRIEASMAQKPSFCAPLSGCVCLCVSMY